jgi:hypothetical protein
MATHGRIQDACKFKDKEVFMKEGKYWDVVDQFDAGIEALALSLRHYCTKEDLVYAVRTSVWVNESVPCNTKDDSVRVVVSVIGAVVEARVFMCKNMDVDIIHKIKIGE